MFIVINKAKKGSKREKKKTLIQNLPTQELNFLNFYNSLLLNVTNLMKTMLEFHDQKGMKLV